MGARHKLQQWTAQEQIRRQQRRGSCPNEGEMDSQWASAAGTAGVKEDAREKLRHWSAREGEKWRRKSVGDEPEAEAGASLDSQWAHASDATALRENARRELQEWSTREEEKWKEMPVVVDSTAQDSQWARAAGEAAAKEDARCKLREWSAQQEAEWKERAEPCSPPDHCPFIAELLAVV